MGLSLLLMSCCPIWKHTYRRSSLWYLQNGEFQIQFNLMVFENWGICEHLYWDVQTCSFACTWKREATWHLYMYVPIISFWIWVSCSQCIRCDINMHGFASLLNSSSWMTWIKSCPQNDTFIPCRISTHPKLCMIKRVPRLMFWIVN